MYIWNDFKMLKWNLFKMMRLKWKLPETYLIKIVGMYNVILSYYNLISFMGIFYFHNFFYVNIFSFTLLGKNFKLIIINIKKKKKKKKKKKNREIKWEEILVYPNYKHKIVISVITILIKPNLIINNYNFFFFFRERFNLWLTIWIKPNLIINNYKLKFLFLREFQPFIRPRH